MTVNLSTILLEWVGIIALILIAILAFTTCYLWWEKLSGNHAEEWRKLISQFKNGTISEEDKAIIKRRLISSPDKANGVNAGHATRRHRGHWLIDHRRMLARELCAARKDLPDMTGHHLVQLFLELELAKETTAKLQGRHWRSQLRGMREMAAMDLRLHYHRLYRLSNGDNKSVRSEAQAVMIKLFGNEGLRFLSVLYSPLTEWQQIRLLYLLADIKEAAPSALVQWLTSSNSSVRRFSLRLIAQKGIREYYDQVCLRIFDDCEQVRLQAIDCLRDIYRADTTNFLIREYPFQQDACQLAILRTIRHIGDHASEKIIDHTKTTALI